MAAYLVRRLLFSVVILWGAVTIVFVVLRLVPADPAVLILGSDATQEEIDALRAEMGLDRSIVAQYGIFLGDMVQGDFGDSYRQQTDAMGLVLERLPATIELAVAALSIAVVVGHPPRLDRCAPRQRLRRPRRLGGLPPAAVAPRLLGRASSSSSSSRGRCSGSRAAAAGRGSTSSCRP